jgi:hypothetical protein
MYKVPRMTYRRYVFHDGQKTKRTKRNTARTATTMITAKPQQQQQQQRHLIETLLEFIWLSNGLLFCSMPTTPEKEKTPRDETGQPKASSPASSDESILHDNPDYIPPNQQDILLTDVTSKKLHTVISGELEVMYLSPAEETQSSPLLGFVFGFNKRLLVNVVTRRRSRRVGGPKYPSFNVVFLCDTVSPSTFICAEAMTVLLGKQNQDAIPETLTVQLADFPFAVEAHVSPFASHYSDVNVIGMDVLTQLKTTIHGKSLSFTLVPDHEYEVE